MTVAQRFGGNSKIDLWERIFEAGGTSDRLASLEGVRAVAILLVSFVHVNQLLRNLSTILRHPAALISEHFPDSPSSRQADLSRPPLAAAGVWDRPERSVQDCGRTPLVESPAVVG